MRKLRRDIIKSINELREEEKQPGVYLDVLGNKVAGEYSEYLI